MVVSILKKCINDKTKKKSKKNPTLSEQLQNRLKELRIAIDVITDNR
jgi:hypothetical protein